MSATVKNSTLIPMPDIRKRNGIRKYLRVTNVRYAVQTFFLVFFTVLPFTGLFRIDLSNGRFVIDGYQVWWSDFFLILPFWLFLISGAAAVYSVLGMVFCGWLCIQNSLSEFVDFIIRKIFGPKKRYIGLDTLTNHPDKLPLNLGIGKWTLFVGSVFLLSLVFGIVFAGYFVAPSVLLSDIRTGKNMAQVFWVIGGIGSVMLMNLFLIRHYWCNWVCPYPLWQHFFKSEGTMKVAFDDSRRDECTGCNLCVRSCIVDIDPRDTKNFTRCINCGECVVVCEDYSGKRGVPSLLTFHFNGLTVDQNGKRRLNRLSPVFSRFFMTGAFSLVPLALFIYGIVSYVPFHFSLSQVPGNLSAYSVRVSNKKPVPATFRIQEKGLPSSVVEWSDRTISVPPGGMTIIPLALRGGASRIAPGLHPFSVRVEALAGKHQVLSQDALFFIPAVSSDPGS